MVKALRLPKFYKNGMVLQADPTEAIIWGFLDGNQNEVFISATCHFKDYSKKNFVKMKATNLKVRIFCCNDCIIVVTLTKGPL